MFCIECGHNLPTSAKFCSECGTPTVASGTSPDLTPSPSDAPVTDPNSPEARQAVIDSGDIGAMQARARAAVRDDEFVEANFWYVEWITASGASPNDIIQGIHEYAREILVPQGRFAECGLYFGWVMRSGTPAQQESALDQMILLSDLCAAQGYVRHEADDRWKTVDVSLPLDPQWTSLMQYRRSFAWLEAKAEADEVNPLLDVHDAQHLPYIAGMVSGLRRTLTELGADVEAAIQGMEDWLRYRFGLTHQESVNTVTSQQSAAPVASVSPANNSPSAPTTNALGQHVDRLFSDKKFAQQIKAALGCSSGVNDDYVVAAIPVSGKLGDYEDGNHQMIFTRDRVAVVKKAGVFSSGDAERFTRSQISHIGIGDSDHYEGQGFGGRTTNWVSLTISLVNGTSYTRHYYLGRNEKEINSNIPYLRENLQRMTNVGYTIADGPGWNSAGGYHMSYGYGVGFWR